MIYFNADGSQSMCGNGARCAVAFSNFLGIIKSDCRFLAIDGPHEARFFEGQVELGMSPVQQISKLGDDYFVNTGSPHHVQFVEDVTNFPVVERGAPIRYSGIYQPQGTNVNFVSLLSDHEIFVRTYERGVENETLSCGTGVTACALVVGERNHINSVSILTPGGRLKVDFTSNPDGSYENILLTGPAEQVFSGKITV
jgi:diaminopimelate epimerase